MVGSRLEVVAVSKYICGLPIPRAGLVCNLHILLKALPRGCAVHRSFWFGAAARRRMPSVPLAAPQLAAARVAALAASAGEARFHELGVRFVAGLRAVLKTRNTHPRTCKSSLQLKGTKVWFGVTGKAQARHTFRVSELKLIQHINKNCTVHMLVEY